MDKIRFYPMKPDNISHVSHVCPCSLYKRTFLKFRNSPLIPFLKINFRQIIIIIQVQHTEIRILHTSTQGFNLYVNLYLKNSMFFFKRLELPIIFNKYIKYNNNVMLIFTRSMRCSVGNMSMEYSAEIETLYI